MNKNDMMTYLHACRENSAGVCAYSKEDVAALERQPIPKSMLDRGRIPYSNLGNPKTNSVHKGSGVIATFSIPRHPLICVGATSECFRRCYAIKAARQYSRTRLARMINYLLTFDPLFEENMVISIRQLQTKLNSRLVGYRIHESGELYSQQYLDVWKRIVRKCYPLKFACYTKNANLDFSGTPPNLEILRSIDESTKDVIPQPELLTGTFRQLRYAISGTDDTFHRGNSTYPLYPLYMSADASDTFTCPKHCADCMFCYSSGTWPYKHVYFQWH